MAVKVVGSAAVMRIIPLGAPGMKRSDAVTALKAGNAASTRWPTVARESCRCRAGARLAEPFTQGCCRLSVPRHVLDGCGCGARRSGTDLATTPYGQSEPEGGRWSR